MRLYRLLLHLFPRSFRVEYGEEMAHVFSEKLRRTSGATGNVGLWIETVQDVTASALRVHGDLLRQDLRYTVRSHARAPGLAVTAVLVTALGIGANTAVFSITDQVLIRPLPFPDSQRLVRLWQRQPGYTRMELSPPNYRDWKRMSSSFEAMATYYDFSMNLVGQGDPVRLETIVTEGELFGILGVPPLLGRALRTEDGRVGAPAAVVLSYGLWQQLFGGSPDVLGKTVRLDDRPSTIVGVMPPDFHFPDPSTQLWTALQFTNDEDFHDRTNSYLRVLAKLGPGVSIDQARAEMELISVELARAYPKENEKTRATVVSLRDEVSVQSRLLLAALFGASICVLLIACANLAHLLLGRGMERQRELTVRAALGAGQERLARQLLTESVALALLGGLAGVGLASVALPLLSQLVPPTLPVAQETPLDVRVLVFAALVTTLTGVAFGILPALRCSVGDMKGLREGPRTGVGPKRQRLRSALVVAEVAASVVLLISSGLLIRALLRIEAVDPGFRTGDVLAVETAVPYPKYETTERRVALYTRVLSNLRTIPGVRSAAYTSFLPMLVGGGIWTVSVPGFPVDKDVPESASLRYVTPDFFSTLGIPIRLGRDVREADTLDAPFVAVVSESFAHRYWPGEDPLGRRFDFAFKERTVVGVVGDIRVRGLERRSEPQVYLPYRQQGDRWLEGYSPKELVLRLEPAGADQGSVVAAVRKVVHEADPELPVSRVRTLEDVVEAQTAPRLTQVRVLGAFAGLSILLTGVGIYGLLSFAVSRRRPEIGLRIAFGARSSDILKMVLGEGALLALSGGCFGVMLGYAAARSMEALLAGVEPADALTYAAAAGVGLVMTLTGSLVPALRALRVDPVETIRAE